MDIEKISFTEIKKSISVQALLEHYKLFANLKPKKGGYRGSCPLHNSKGSASFHVSTAKNAFYCFGCKRGGSILDFVATRENVSLVEASRLLVGWFGLESEQTGARPDPSVVETEPDAQDEENAINAVLRFPGLKGLDTEHSYLRELGIPSETVAHFEAGFCRRGMMKGRVAIPWHNRAGGLIGYAGLDPQSGEFLHPDNLSPHVEVYNLHRQEPGAPLVVVSMYIDVWRLHVAGIENAVALWDGRLTRHQEQLLEEFKPERLLLLQTTHQHLHAVTDRMNDRFFTGTESCRKAQTWLVMWLTVSLKTESC